MRYIIKGEPDEQLAKENAKPSTQYRKAVSRWERFRKSKKVEGTRKQCLEGEQFGLCCYSEINLLTGEGIDKELGFHLEHVEPKKRIPSKTFDHNNLLACAIDDRSRVEKHNLFGGHSRLEWWEPEQFIHPLRTDCTRYFHYNDNGRVVPNESLLSEEKNHAQLTIDKLNLNAPILVGWREQWIANKRTLLDDFIDEPDTLKQLAREELLPQANNQLKPFHSAIRQLFGQIAEEVIAESETTRTTTT